MSILNSHKEFWYSVRVEISGRHRHLWRLETVCLYWPLSRTRDRLPYLLSILINLILLLCRFAICFVPITWKASSIGRRIGGKEFLWFCYAKDFQIRECQAPLLYKSPTHPSPSGPFVFLFCFVFKAWVIVSQSLRSFHHDAVPINRWRTQSV